MMGKLFTLPKQVVLAASGTIPSLIPGARAYFYANGTSTPQDTYQDLALTTPHANPVIADAAGRFPAIYLDTSFRYKLVIKDASDIEVYTEDDYTSPFDWGWEQTAEELASGIAPITETHLPGDAARYGDCNFLDGTNDDTAVFRNAILSGHPAHCSLSGTSNIEGTIVMDGDQTLTLHSGLRLDRLTGSSTEPVLHIYGSENILKANSAQFAITTLSHPKGVVLLGQDPAEKFGGTTDVTTHGNAVYDIKVSGAAKNIAQDGSPGIYIHSIRRKMYGTSNADRKSTYYNKVVGANILNCDVLMEFSTDANNNTVEHPYFHQWKEAAVKMSAAIENKISNFAMETPLEVSKTRRYAFHLLAQNGSAIETDTDASYGVDAAHQNYFQGSGELPGSGNNVVSLFDHNETGSVFGENEIEYKGALGAGIGKNGLSDAANLGTNIFNGYSAYVNRSRPTIHFNHEIRDGLYASDSYAVVTGRKTGLAESSSTPFIEIDDIGPTREVVFVKIMLAARGSTSDGLASTREEHWILQLEQSDTYTTPEKFFQSFSDGAETDVQPVVTVSAVSVAGTTADTMKSIFSIECGTGFPQTNRFYVTWKAEILVANLNGTSWAPESQITLL